MQYNTIAQADGGGKFHALIVGMALVGMTVMYMPPAEAVTKVIANVKYKDGNLRYSGKLKGVDTGTQVSIYDGSTGLLLHSMQSDAKNKFSYELPVDNAPCNVRIVAGDGEKVTKVKGADKACKTELACALTSDKLNAKAGEAVDFTGFAKGKIKKNQLPEMSLDYGNGATDSVTASKAKGGALGAGSQTFTDAGRYKVTYTASLNGSQCQDSVVVTVGPDANPPQVAEAVARPGVASGMTGNYAIIPFADRSDVGVANDSPDTYLQTQSLNAIVYQKAPKKPIVLGMDDVDVFYSAAINPNDPVGADSINSTSQNWFSDGTAGANYDTAAADVDSKDGAKRNTVLLEGKDFAGPQTDGVKKTGMYDRILNRDGNGGSEMTAKDARGAGTELTKPDEGLRASKDLMAGTQSMPGRTGAYLRNDEQKINAFDNAGFFSAQMLPVVGVDDKGRKNPFPMMRVAAKNDSINVATDAALISSSEMSCAQCHSKGGISGDDMVWHTPVGPNDPEAKGDGSSLGPNSGSSYPAGRDGYNSLWAPAVQNRFELKIVSTQDGKNTYQMVNPLNPDSEKLRTEGDQDELFKPIFVKKDGADYISDVTGEPMILRGDRVKAYQFNAEGKLQIQLNFAAPENDSPQAREKAAVLNMAIMHDYYDSYGPTNPAGGPEAARTFSTQFADAIEDKTAANTENPTSCGGHHFSNSNHDVGRGSFYDAHFVYSNYSRAMHGFHGRLQVYKEDVSAADAADGMAHSKGDLIRDSRGNHIPFGGAGWDPEKKNNYKTNVAGQYDGIRNDFDPVAFPMHAKGELLLPFDLKRDANGEMVNKSFTANTNSTDMTKNCSVCHAGKTEQVYHDMHYSAGLTCESCHGDMQAVGAMWLKPGTNYTDHKHKNFRVFDYEQPNCESCHAGSHDKVGRLAFAAWDKSATSLTADAGTIDQRFAIMPKTLEVKRPGLAGRPTDANGVEYDKVCLGTHECDDAPLDGNGQLKEISTTPLFRKSVDTHGNVPCAACHGPAHTIWPVQGAGSNHNVTAKQLQGYEGTLVECDVCHSKDGDQNSFANGELANDQAIAYGKRGLLVKPDAPNAYLAGPHGMHPVNDENWYKHNDAAAANTSKGKHKDGLNGGWHNDMAKKPGPNGEDQCAACHGDDHKGTRLSRTLVDRVFTNAKGKQISIKAGTIIGCNTCHSLKKSFEGAPDPKAKDGGWPKPPVTQQPVTPMTQPADTRDVDVEGDPGSATGGGGHG